MVNHRFYFPVSAKDESWGLTVLNAGNTHIEKYDIYPPENHPSDYNFDWETGRILNEYQLIYIIQGTGQFESESCKESITEGSVILIHPNERHRYKPSLNTGWDEMWVGFRGSIVDNIILNGYFNQANSVFHIGYNETIINLFYDIINMAKEEKSGYQPAISGAVVYLLGLLHSIYQENQFASISLAETIVSRARVMFREKLNQRISAEDVANELQVGYSWFRKIFKNYTGLSPGQYLIQLKIQKAKELLANPSKLIKEIAFELNIESPLYFAKLFKEKTGVTPAEYRKRTLK